jgi:ABC-type multidrug transport system fused ATPase/permease subunit
VFENVAYGKPNATKNEVIEACEYLFFVEYLLYYF